MARAYRLVRRLRREARFRCIDLDEGMQLRIVRRDPRQQRIHDIDRRQAPRRNLPRQDMSGSETGIAVHAETHFSDGRHRELIDLRA